GSEFWQSELPLRALDAILESETRLGSIDTLIVDEAQDLLQAHYLDVLDALLAGGLSSGVWRFFGDFEKQSIYGTSNLSDSEFVNSLSSGVPRFLLTRNCRNTPRIAAFVTLLADFTNGYREVLRPDTGY